MNDKSGDEKGERQLYGGAQGEGSLAAVKCEATLPENFDLHASQTVQWAPQLLKVATGDRLRPAENREAVRRSVKDTQANIGYLTLENDFLEVRSVLPAMRMQ